MAELTNTTGATATRLGEFLNSEGNVNYDAVRSRVQQAAQQTRQVQGPTSVPKEAARAVQALKPSSGYWSTVKPTAENNARYAEAVAAKEKFQTDVAVTQAQAAKAAEALEMQGDATVAYLKRLEGLGTQVAASGSRASDLWNQAVEKADEYVKSARARVGQVLTKLESLSEDITKDWSFSKAHDMQVAAQGVLGAMKAEEKGILENYGPDSAEYQQFKMTKARSLALAQSDIHGKYNQTWTAIKTSVLNATNEAMQKLHMYTSFQEQQHVETLKAMAQYSAAYEMQVAQTQLGIENLKMAGLENLANWLVQTPTFSTDMGPFLAQLSELAEATRQERVEVNSVDMGSLARASQSRSLEGLFNQSPTTRKASA